MCYLLQHIQDKDSGSANSSHFHVCVEIDPVSSFVQDMIFFLLLLFNYFLLLFPAETILWELSQKGWMTYEMSGVEISNIPKSRAKSCRAEMDGMAQLGFQSY